MYLFFFVLDATISFERRFGRQSLCCFACLMSCSHLWLGFTFFFFFAPRSTSQRVTNNATNIRCVLAGRQLGLQNHASQTKWHLSSCLQSRTTPQERVRVKSQNVVTNSSAKGKQRCAFSQPPPLFHEVSWPHDWLMMRNIIKFRLVSQCLCS